MMMIGADDDVVADAYDVAYDDDDSAGLEVNPDDVAYDDRFDDGYDDDYYN